MRTVIIVITAAITLLGAVPALAADAVGCLHRCSAQCYGKPSPSSCEASCNAYCINQRDAAPEICGSIVVADGVNASMGWSWSAPDRTSAEKRGWDECIKGAPSCRPVITFCNECAAVVRAWDSKTLLGSFGSRRPAAADAERSAMAQCQERFPKASCKVAKKICADRGPN
jgi:hypothetical protein